MEATDLRLKVDELETKITILLEKFITDVGPCDINIDVELSRMDVPFSRTIYGNLNVKVKVTV